MTETTAPRADLKLFLRDMLRIRRVEERIAELYPEQEMRCPVHLCIGQEASPVGVCAALEPDDYVLGGHRAHGHYLAKGGSLDRLVAELYGKVTGCARGKGGSMHLVDRSVGFVGSAPIVGSTIPIAVGTAFASSMLGEDRVSVVFFGEGATEEGAFQESLVFAALRSLPIVFVCENNLYSVYSPLSVRQAPSRDICAVSRANGVPAVHGDGNDVEVVYALAAAAVEAARAGGGPTLLELDTYRWREHCGPFYDNDLGYREATEIDEWEARCPIESLQRRLVHGRVLEAAEIQAMTVEIETEIDAAVRFAKESPFPPRDDLYADVYG